MIDTILNLCVVICILLLARAIYVWGYWQGAGDEHVGKAKPLTKPLWKEILFL